MAKKVKNIEGLLSYSNARNQETLKKVNEAIDRLKHSETKPINFCTVSEESGVAKATLYNNEAIRERIMNLRSIQKGHSHQASKGGGNDCNDEIKRLNEEVKQLRADKKKLVAQLVEMEVLKDENKMLKRTLEKIRLQN